MTAKSYHQAVCPTVSIGGFVVQHFLQKKKLRRENRRLFDSNYVIPSHRLTTYGRRAFSVAGPMFWNSLPAQTPA